MTNLFVSKNDQNIIYVQYRLYLLRTNNMYCRNVLKSGTLLSATPERHSQNQEQKMSATHFFIKRSDVGVALLFLRREKI